MNSAHSKTPVRILLVDDHELFREGLSRLLQADPAVRLVAHCGSIAEALAIVSDQTIDLILLDIDLGREDGTELLRRLTLTAFQGRVLAVTAAVDEARTRELIRLGVAGIFLKHNSPALLSQSIRQVMEGRTWFDQTSDQGQHHSFTPREKQVLRLVLQGRQNKEIASQLDISESAAKAAMQQLFNKTGVRTRSQLVRVALEQYRHELL